MEEIDKNKDRVKEAERKALRNEILPMPVPNNFDPFCCGDLGTKTETVFGGSGKTTKTVCKTGNEDKNDDGGGDDAACFDSIWQKTRKTFC